MGGKRGAKYYISCWRDFTGFIAPVYKLSDAKLTSYRQYQTQLPIAGLPQGFYSYVCMHVHPLVATADVFWTLTF